MPLRFDVRRRKRLVLAAAGGLMAGLLVAVWLLMQPRGASTVEGPQVGPEQLASELPAESSVVDQEPFVSVLAVERPDAERASALTVESPNVARSAAPTVELPAQPVTWTISLPVIAYDYPPSPSPFGVEMQYAINASEGLTRALEVGAGWVRFSAFQWDEIEPARTDPPTYLWETVDEQSLHNAALNNIEVIAIIRYAPVWAQKVEGLFCGPIHEDRLDEFAQFLQALVTRYSVPPYSLQYWELGNEPDVDPSLVGPHSVFGCWGDHDDPYYGGGYYAEMLKVAYPAIKAADPDAQVLIGGLLLDCDPRVAGACHGAEGDLPPKFLEGILQNGGGPYFDIVSFHAYTYYYDWLGFGQMLNPRWPEDMTAIPEKASFLREVLDTYGFGGKALLNTETALWCPELTADCLETQAMFIPRAYAEAMALNLKAQIYFALINDWNYTGLLLTDLTPKPAYYAYKAASEFLSSTIYSGTVAVYPAGVEGYTFRHRSGKGYLDIIWSEDGSAQSIELPGGAHVYDRYGAAVPLSGTLEVDYSPVYVTRP